MERHNSSSLLCRQLVIINNLHLSNTINTTIILINTISCSTKRNTISLMCINHL